MNAVPPSFDVAPDAAGLRWTALANAAAVVASLAGLEHEHAALESDEMAGRLGQAQGWRRVLADNGIADLAATMEPGIAALLAVQGRGMDAQPAAAALWREFCAAREGIAALLAPPRT